LSSIDAPGNLELASVRPPRGDISQEFHGFEGEVIDRNARGLDQLRHDTRRRRLSIPIGGRGRARIDRDYDNVTQFGEAHLVLERRTRLQLFERFEHAT
jgi:hypothetical protein